MRKTDKNIILLGIVSVFAIVIWIILQFTPSPNSLTTPYDIDSNNDDVDMQGDVEDRSDIIEDEQGSSQLIESISVTELSQLMNNVEQITIIDTRSAEAFSAGHIRGSFSVHEIDTFSSLSEKIILVSDSGNEDLVMKYYRDLPDTASVYNLSGGIYEWNKSGYALISLENTPDFASSGKVQFVEPRDLNDLISSQNSNEEIVIIDTRRSGNFLKSHIPLAINIPLSDLEYRFKEIPRNKDIYVYGADDATSFQAGVLFHDLRFIGTKTINGGFAAWERFGYPTTVEQK